MAIIVTFCTFFLLQTFLFDACCRKAFYILYPYLSFFRSTMVNHNKDSYLLTTTLVLNYYFYILYVFFFVFCIIFNPKTTSHKFQYNALSFSITCFFIFNQLKIYVKKQSNWTNNNYIHYLHYLNKKLIEKYLMIQRVSLIKEIHSKKMKRREDPLVSIHSSVISLIKKI